MAILIVVVVIFGFGYYFGLRHGGERALRTLSETEHEIRRSRAGLK